MIEKELPNLNYQIHIHNKTNNTKSKFKLANESSDDVKSTTRFVTKAISKGFKDNIIKISENAK